MKLNQSKINEYVNELSYLTDLNTCIYFDGYKCTLLNKECKGRVDIEEVEIPCNGKEYKTITDSITARLDLSKKSE